MHSNVRQEYFTPTLRVATRILWGQAENPVHRFFRKVLNLRYENQ